MARRFIFLPLHRELFDALKDSFLLALIPRGPSSRQCSLKGRTLPKPSHPSLPLLLIAFRQPLLTPGPCSSADSDSVSPELGPCPTGILASLAGSAR